MSPTRGPIAVVFGTRPEAIKLARITHVLGDCCVIVHTGQHWDERMAARIHRDVGIRSLDYSLGIGGLSRGEQIGIATTELSRLFERIAPVAVIVQGDTNSALAGALAANAGEIPLIHIEAGLRSHDRAMPEEHNRVVVDHLADLCCAPTTGNASSLRVEGIGPERVVVTGNTVVEAVHRLVPPPAVRSRLLRASGLAPDSYVLATIHRPENTDGPALGTILGELSRLPLPVLLPTHPRTARRVQREGIRVGPNVVLSEPLGYRSFLALLAECAVCVSDSGGIQEEVTVLGRPLVVVRNSTERPETQGRWSTLVQPGPEVGGAVAGLLDDLRIIHARLASLPTPYGDDLAPQRCVAAVKELLAG